MHTFNTVTDPRVVAALKRTGVGVIPTDTVYGIVARAQDPAAIEKLYQVRGRSPDKPSIMLVAELRQITDTQNWSKIHWKLAEKYWPGPLSLVAPVSDDQPLYVHRPTHTLAYRVPADADLRKLLAQTGPLIAPSANLEGQPPATTIAEAKAYFGDSVDFYVDGGELVDRPSSTVVTVQDGRAVVLRRGAVQIVRYT